MCDLRPIKPPGMVKGWVTGLLVGGLVAVAGAPTGYIIVAALGFGIPLTIFGIVYHALLDAGKLSFGYAAPTALYGVLTPQEARLIQELLLTAVFGQGITLQQEEGELSSTKNQVTDFLANGPREMDCPRTLDECGNESYLRSLFQVNQWHCHDEVPS